MRNPRPSRATPRVTCQLGIAPDALARTVMRRALRRRRRAYSAKPPIDDHEEPATDGDRSTPVIGRSARCGVGAARRLVGRRTPARRPTPGGSGPARRGLRAEPRRRVGAEVGQPGGAEGGRCPCPTAAVNASSSVRPSAYEPISADERVLAVRPDEVVDGGHALRVGEAEAIAVVGNCPVRPGERDERAVAAPRPRPGPGRPTRSPRSGRPPGPRSASAAGSGTGCRRPCRRRGG